jgi:hypothetical protein
VSIPSISPCLYLCESCPRTCFHACWRVPFANGHGDPRAGPSRATLSPFASAFSKWSRIRNHGP